VALLEEGYDFPYVAQRVATHPQTVRRWWRPYQRDGEAALTAKGGAGAPRKLSAEQRDDLADRLAQGAQAEGFATDMWTCPRVQWLIEQAYGVHYHVDHLPKLLKELGFSPSEARTPRRRARRSAHSTVDRARLASYQAPSATAERASCVPG
jgi:transposase